MTIHYAAVVVAAIAVMVLGSIWYSPVGFARAWVELAGLKMDEIDKSAAMKGYLIAFLCNLVRAYVLAWLVVLSGASGLSGGLRLGAWIGLGIVATTMAPHYFFSQRPRKLYLIDAGHSVLAVILSTVILAMWVW